MQACEQLNAWLSGFQTILNRMTDANFNWYLHTMLHLHSMRIMAKIANKEEGVALPPVQTDHPLGDEIDVDEHNLDVNVE